MSAQEFPSELVERCGNHLARTAHLYPEEARAMALTVLRESGYADLVAALKGAKPYVWSPAQFKGDKRAQDTLKDIDAALHKAGEL